MSKEQLLYLGEKLLFSSKNVDLHMLKYVIYTEMVLIYSDMKLAF